MAFTPVTITHDFGLPDTGAAVGTVEFALVAPLHNGGNTVSGVDRAVLGSGGVLSQQVAATTDPGTTPPGTPYRITVRITGQPARTYYAPIPHNQGSTLDLGTLLAWVAAGYGGGYLGPITLTASSGTITPDAALGGLFRHTATGDVQLLAPVNGYDGQEIVVEVLAADTNRVLSFWPGGPAPVTIPVGTWWGGRLRYLQSGPVWLLDVDGAARVASVNGQTGTVVLTPDSFTDGTTNHVFTAADDSKLGGIAVGATANSTDAALLNRANHTGTQAISTVTSLQTTLDARAPLASPTFTGTVTLPRTVSTPVTVTYAATTTIDASLGTRFRVTATGDLTLAAPTNPVDGQQITVTILASGANRALTISGSIVLTTGISSPITITSGKRWIGGLVYDGDAAAWLLMASTQTA